MPKLNKAERDAQRANANAVLAFVAPAALKEGASAVAVAMAIQDALAGFKLGHWDASAKEGKGAFIPSVRFNAVYDEYGIGYLAARLPGCDNMDDAAKLEKAREVYADPKRGDAANTIKASGRQSWKRALQRAGIETPRPKDPPAPKKRQTRTSTENEGDQPSDTVVLTKAEAAKVLPPKGDKAKDRAAVVEYLRLQLANMLREVERFNQQASKAKSEAMPPKVLGDIEEWRNTAKTWAF